MQWQRVVTPNAGNVVETGECELASAVAGNTLVLQEDIARESAPA